jgi:SAM-dependent methyltransferase
MSRAAAALKRVVRGVIRRTLGIGPIRRLVESELKRSPARAPAPPKPLPTFTDGRGVQHQLDPLLRDKLKPNWRAMTDPAEAAAPPDDETLRGRLRKATKSVAEVERILALTCGAKVTGRILEVGCYDGSAAYELSQRPGASVVASDLARYYVVQRPGQPEAEAIVAEEDTLTRLRDRVRLMAGRPPGSVTFVEDDITASTLDRGSFDLILSFEVLEHVERPRDAFAAMAGLLRPGGIVYHDYNPFFSANGGHSLATLDLPWGHARFGDDDVERYLREIRPGEADQALRFYRNSLNRMTLAELREAIAAAGLETVAIIPWYQRSLVADATPEVLSEVQATYPSATADDLLATFVAVVARKPA